MKSLAIPPASMPEAWIADTMVPTVDTLSSPGRAKGAPGAAAVGGSASKTTGGTVNAPSVTRAVQANETVAVVSTVAPYRLLVPAIVTYPAGSPPVQVTVAPFARTMVERLDELVQVNTGGMV